MCGKGRKYRLDFNDLSKCHKNKLQKTPRLPKFNISCTFSGPFKAVNNQSSYSYCTRELPTTIRVWMPQRKPRLNSIFTHFVHRFFQDLIVGSHSFQTPRLQSSPRKYPYCMNVATSAGHILYSLCLRFRSFLLCFLSLQCVLCKGNTLRQPSGKKSIMIPKCMCLAIS